MAVDAPIDNLGELYRILISDYMRGKMKGGSGIILPIVSYDASPFCPPDLFFSNDKCNIEWLV